MAPPKKTPAQKRRARKKAKEKAQQRAQTMYSSSSGDDTQTATGNTKIKRRKKEKKEDVKPKKKSFLGRLILYSFIFFIVLAGGLFAFQGPLLNYGFQEGKPHIINFAQKAGISISELDAKDLAFAGTDAITFGSFSTTMILPNKKELALALQETKGSFDFKLNTFSLKGNEFNIQIRDPNNEKAKPMVFKGSKLKLDSPVDRSNPQGSIQEIIKQFQMILDTGSTPLEVSLKGTLAMEYEGESRDVGIKTTRNDDVTYLQMDKESLLSIIGSAADELTDAEVQVLADYPLRAATLLRIQKYAKGKAANLAVQPNFPEDAYRHILWNFVLTNEFGEEFAKLVTDAHEIGAESNSEFDHKMDYNNNAIGRKYALTGVKEADIAQKVQTDPNVIKLSDQ